MISMNPGQVWVTVISLASASAAAWILIGAAFRAVARRWRKARTVLAAARPEHGGVTLHVLPCGCIYYYLRVDRDPCGPHARKAADRDEINRLDQQIRNMP